MVEKNGIEYTEKYYKIVEKNYSLNIFPIVFGITKVKNALFGGKLNCIHIVINVLFQLNTFDR